MFYLIFSSSILFLYVYYSPSLQRTVNISCKASLLAKSSLIFVWLIVFISPLVLKDNFTGYRIPDWWGIFFSQYFKYFITLSSCFHGFWEDVIFILFLLGKAFIQSHFRIFFLFLIFCSLKVRCISVCFCIYLAWCSGFPSLSLSLLSNMNLGKILNHHCFKYFSFCLSLWFLLAFLLHASYPTIHGYSVQFFSICSVCFWFTSDSGFMLYSLDKLSLFVSGLISSSKAFSFLLQCFLFFFFNLQH